MISLIKDIHLLTLYKDISKEITCFDFETFCNSVDINKYKIKYDTAYQTLTHCLYDKNLSLEPLCISKTVDLFVRYIYVPDITDTRPGIYKQHIVSDNDTTNKYLLISILSDYVNNPYLIVFKYRLLI